MQIAGYWIFTRFVSRAAPRGIAAMKDKYHELLYLEALLDVGENASLL